MIRGHYWADRSFPIPLSTSRTVGPELRGAQTTELPRTLPNRCVLRNLLRTLYGARTYSLNVVNTFAYCDHHREMRGPCRDK
jgi:hypothetical protein